MSDDLKLTIGSIAFGSDNDRVISGVVNGTVQTTQMIRTVLMVPSINLRYDKKTGQLQQMWYDFYHSDTKEWRDIPTEE